jgi:hypothetical protein
MQMKRALPRIALFLWAFIFGTGAALSTAGAADLGDAVPGHKNLTYFDLMRQVVPDLTLSDKGDATGHKTIPFAHIEGKDSKVDLPATINFASIEALPIPGERIILLADLGQAETSTAGANLLALFALTPSVNLLDVAEVGTDRFTGFRAGALQMLAPDTPLLLVDSSHFNSNQNYNSTEMIFIHGDRFRLIESVFTFRDSSCSYERTQEPSFTLLPAPRPYRAVQVSVHEAVKLTEQDCGGETPPPAKPTTYETIFHWDEAKQSFLPSSDALQRLLDEDQKRF